VVGEAIDGPEALHKTGLLRPQLILIDMDLPGLNGLEVTRRIKAAAPERRVILFSMVEGQEYRAAAARSGVDSFLPKTAPIFQILTTIKKWSPPMVA